jgi:phage shock protein E
LIFSILFSLTACSQQADIKPEDVPDDIIIIDTRTQGEYDAGHIEGADLIPFNIIANKIEVKVPDKEANIALYCRSGRRSGIATKTLQKMGYKNAKNYGGLGAAAKTLQKKIVR